MLNETVDPARRTKIMLKQSALKHCITNSQNNCDIMLTKTPQTDRTLHRDLKHPTRMNI